MDEGAALIRGTVWGFIVVGFSWMKLFFRPEGGDWRSDVVVFSPEHRKVAYRCPKCASVLIEEAGWIPTTRTRRRAHHT
jgi:hypothetical protein